jgi:hypothetical protein
MITENGAVQESRQWASILFFAAGSFMLVNVVSLWVMNYSNTQISLLWAAIPGIVALTASIIGLFTLYPRISSQAPWLARCGVGFALIAGASLCMAAIWIFGIEIFLGKISEHLPGGVMALIGVFMVSMAIAFICYATAFLIYGSSQGIGYLLMVPVVSWVLMLVVGITEGLLVGLRLDLYTNGFIAVAFIFIGLLLKKKRSLA